MSCEKCKIGNLSLIDLKGEKFLYKEKEIIITQSSFFLGCENCFNFSHDTSEKIADLLEKEFKKNETP